MNHKDQKFLSLQTLIQGTASFSPEEKSELLIKIEELKESEIIQAISVFEQEKIHWLNLKKTAAQLAKKNEEASKATIKEIKALSKGLIKQKESQNKIEEMRNAETLLTEI